MEPCARPTRRRAAIGTAALIWILAPMTAAQVGPTESAAKARPAEGLEATLWAAEPMVSNPTSLDVDSRGRVWVAEGRNYRVSRAGNRRFPRDEGGDRIKILEDVDGDGRADTVSVFADHISPVPMGMAVEERYDADGRYAGCRVYLGVSPNILVLEDVDGDDRADRRFNLLTGFGGLDSDHGVHGMTLGLDGKLYFTHGDGCCSLQEDGSERNQNFDVTDASGRRVRPRRHAHTLRVDRDGTEFEVVCDGQRNNYEICLNAFGEGFVSDNDDDGDRGCRVIHAMDGGDFGYRTPGSVRHWGEDVPGIVPKLVGTGNGSPCGIAAYESRLIPGLFGGLLEADAGSRQVNGFPLERRGASYRTEPRVLLASDDPWFRPTDVAVGPDGSAFVADWYDAGVGGHGLSDQDTGRIYRLAPRGVKPQAIPFDFGTVAGLIEALKRPNVASQDAARRGLIARGDAGAAALRELVRDGAPEEAARGLQTAVATPALAGLAAEILQKPGEFPNRDPRLRELAVRILGRDCRENGEVEYRNPEARKPPAALAHLDVLLPLAADPDAGLRRELLLALRHVPTPKAAASLRTLVSGWDGRDRWYLEALGLALENREPEFVTSLMDASLFGDPAKIDEEADDDAVALPPYFPVDRNEAFIPAGAADPRVHGLSKLLGFLWRLQRPEALPVLESLLPQLKAAGLQQAGDDVLTRVRSPYAADVAALLAERTQDPARRSMLLDLLATQLAGPWNPARDRPAVLRVVEAALQDPGRVRQGIAMAAATGDARYRAAFESLAVAPEVPDEVAARAVEAIGAVGGPPSRILSGLIAETRTGGASARAEAAVRALPKMFDARDRLLEILTDRGFPAPIRREALRTLARSPDGAFRIVESAKAGDLPDDLKTEAATTLNASSDPRAREAAAGVLPLPATASGRPLPPIAELLRRPGDPGRGEAVFFRKTSDACASCHRVQGRGRWIGPDLSTIGVKYGKDELLNSILNPSAAISYNFRSLILALTDGRIVTGLPVEESSRRIVVKTADGERVEVAPGEVEERRFAETSLMPDNLAGSMSDGDLVDLLAYLSTLKRPVAAVGRLQATGPIAVTEPDPADIDPRAAIRDDEGRPASWRRVDADVEGRIDLGPFLAPKKAAFASASITTAAAQRAKIVVDGPADVEAWVDGRPVALERAEADAPATAEVDLPAGSSRFLVRIRPAAKDRGELSITVVSPNPVAFDAEAAPPSGR